MTLLKRIRRYVIKIAKETLQRFRNQSYNCYFCYLKIIFKLQPILLFYSVYHISYATGP